MADIDDNLSGSERKLPEGWEKKVTQRSQGKSAGKFDVYIISPDGKKFRSRTELIFHLRKNNFNLSIDDFDFTASQKGPGSPKPVAKLDKSPAGKKDTKGQKSKGRGFFIKMKFDKKKSDVDSENEECDTEEEPKSKDTASDSLVENTISIKNTDDEPNQVTSESDKPAKTDLNVADIEPTDNITKHKPKQESNDNVECETDKQTPIETENKVTEKCAEEEKHDSKPIIKEEKRGRRATKKESSVPTKKETKKEEPIKKEVEEVPRRGRGRPKRSDDKPDVKEELVQDKVEPKQTRGKSKKIDPISDTIKDVELPPRSARIRAKKEEIQEPEDEVPSRGRGRPKKIETPKNDKKESSNLRKPTTEKKNKIKSKKKPQIDPDNPDDIKNAQILAEIDAELAEINGTKKKRSPAKRKSGTSVVTPIPKLGKEDKDRPALEGFEPQLPNKRRRSDSKTVVEPEMPVTGPTPSKSEAMIPESTRQSSRRKRVTAKASESIEQEESQEAEPIPSTSTKKSTKKLPVKKGKADEKKILSRNRRMSKVAKVSEDLDEGESILLDSLEGAINSASSLLDGSSDSSHEGELQDTEVVTTKQSRSGRNVRSPRRPMESDFETDFSVLRKAMNATTATSEVTNRKRRNSSSVMFPLHQTQQRLPIIVDYDLGYEQRGDTARTRTFDENIKEKTFSLLDNSGAAESGYLNLDIVAPPPPSSAKVSAPKKQRKSSSATDVKPHDHEKVMFKKQKSSSKQAREKKDRSLLHPKRTVSDSEVVESPLSPPIGSKISRDLLEFEMTPPPTNPIIPSDDHSYSLSSRYYADQTAAQSQASSSSDMFDDAVEGTSSVAVETLPIHLGDHESPTSPGGGASSPPKQIVIYVGDKPTVVPVMQDESGMSVITLPNGLADEN